MAILIQRRELITLLGSVAAWPLAARAQRSALPVVGYLGGLSRNTYGSRLAAFHRGLRETGYVDGESIAVEYRWADGQYDRLPALAADLVGRKVAVMAALGGDAPAHAAKAATSTIPVVFAVTADPVKAGLVASLNRPGGNLTGVNFLLNMIPAKQFEVLHEAVPKANVIGFLINPSGPEGNAAANVPVRQAPLQKRRTDGADPPVRGTDGTDPPGPGGQMVPTPPVPGLPRGADR